MATPCEARVTFVLEQFAAMGATVAELAHEREQLLTDDAYYRRWCGDIHEWCPAWTETRHTRWQRGSNLRSDAVQATQQK